MDRTLAIDGKSGLMGRGETHRRLGAHAKAIEDLTAAIAALPDGGFGYCRRAETYPAIGETGSAQPAMGPAPRQNRISL